MATPAAVFAIRVAEECAEAAENLCKLQDCLGDHICAPNGEDIFIEIQTLDGVQQTLADLASVFANLALSMTEDHPPVSNEVLARITQETLRARLSGITQYKTIPDIELF